MLTQASEDYLKAIYKLKGNLQQVSTNQIAERMGVRPATVTSMLKQLAKLNLIQHTLYYGVQLTEAGEKVALEIIRHHRLLELYLASALGVSWDKVDAEADRLEHHMSEEVEAKVDEMLGFPQVDPHGDPIPSRDGSLSDPAWERLTDLEPGQAAVVRRVSDRDPERLRYLADIGLVPQTTIEVLEKAPFDGPLTLKVGRRQYAVGRELASEIRVEEIKIGVGA